MFKNGFYIFLTAFLWGGITSAKALEYVPVEPANEQYSELGSKKVYDTSFELSMSGDIYVTDNDRELSNGQVQGRFRSLQQKRRHKLFIDIGAGGLVGEETENYIILPQAYYKHKFSGSAFSMTLGRSVEKLSELDEYWMLGDIQPLFRWNAPRPEQQGLTGVYLNYDRSFFHWKLFASPLYLPTQGPSYQLSDGELRSGNPWFSAPVNRLVVGSSIYDLRFDIDLPDIPDIVFNPSWGTQIRLESPNQPFWFQASFFQKQRNELALPFDPTLIFGDETAIIDVFPQVVDHQIVSADLGWRSRRLGVTLSVVAESDLSFDVKDADWVFPGFSDQQKLSSTFFWQVNPFHRLSTGWLSTENNEIEILGGLAGIDGIEAYNFRNQYNNVVDLRWSSVYSSRPYGFRFQGLVRAAYDYEQETTQVSVDWIYKPSKQTRFFARFDFFGGDEELTFEYSDMMSQYLRNDRIQLGGSYVF